MPGKLKYYKVKVNEFEFTIDSNEFEMLDIIQKPGYNFHLLSNHQSFKGVLIEEDLFAKKQVIEIDGERFHVEIKDELDQVLDQMGFSTVASSQVKEIKAPMPGLVLDIAVSEGQAVHEGDKILILVAMKMENVIVVHADATIHSILVKPGQAVEKGQVLVKLD